MSRILILYASSFGQTRRIACALGDRFRLRGHEVELADVAVGIDHLPPPADYDAVVLGSRIQFGRHARGVADYVRAHRAALFDVSSAFFSVSMAASDVRAGTDPNAYMRAFFDLISWHPLHAAAFGGGLPYRHYGRVVRFVMKQISRVAGRTTDTSRNHEFTDWAAVARFADEIALDLAPRPDAVVEPVPGPRAILMRPRVRARA
jgi:menaquinone-dependent protoporphyrinogen oxidase